MTAIIRKDLLVFFGSPLATVTLAVFVFIAGFAFTAQVASLTPASLPEASMRGMTYFLALLLLFLCPLVTMRSFADEVRLQTMELLRTAPISETRLVFGKFLAAWFFAALMILTTVEFPLIMWLFGTPELAPLLTNYLGLLLLVAAFIAVGVFMSSLVRSPMLAALLSFATLLLLWFVGAYNTPWAEQISIIQHLDSFSLGVLDLGDTAYYVLVTAGFLFLTIRLQEMRR